MKRFYKFLMPLVAIVALALPVRTMAQATSCPITIVGNDSYGDGWNGASISIYQGSTLVGTFTLSSGLTNTELFTVLESDEDSVRLVWNSGSWDSETSFIIYNADGTIVLSASGNEFEDGDEIVAFVVLCPSCVQPSNFAVVQTDDYANFSWTDPNGSAWEFAYGAPGFEPDEATNVESVTATTYTLDYTSLDEGQYEAYVRANCGGEYSSWVGPVQFSVGVIIMNMAISGSDTLHTCNAVIYDDGGPNGSYSSNCQSTIVIFPGQENSVVSISGTSYTEGSWDYLTIYSGVGTEGEILWTDNGVSATQNFGPLLSEAITIVFHSDGSLTYDGFTINVTCETAPTCPRPESLTISNVTSNSVTLSWVDPEGSNWLVEYGPAGFIPGDESNPNIHFAEFSTTTGTITELSAGVNYDFYLMSVCGTSEGDTSWTLMVNTYTDCDDIADLPYLENFDGLESGSSAQFHPCWTKGNNFGGDYPYVYSSSYLGLNSNALYFYFTSYNTPDGQAWAVMPTLGEDIELNTLELTFTGNPCYTYENYSHNLLIGVIDSNAYVENMPIDTIAVLNINSEETYYVNFANYEGSGKNIIFFGWLDGNSSYGYLAIDDVDLHVLPSCMRPDSLSLVAADSGSLEITWVGSEESTDFYVEWRNAATPTAAFSGADVSDNSYIIENLSSNTLYDVRVRTVCGDDTSFAAIAQFRTSCVPVTEFPWVEGFEGSSALCWRSVDYNNYSSDDWTLSEYSYAHAGTHSYSSSYYSDGIGSNWLISPAIEIPDDMTNATLSWYIAGGAFLGVMPHYALKVSTVSDIDTTTFTTLLEEDRDDYDDDTYTFVFEKRSVSLEQYAGQTIYIAFVRYARDDDGLYLDDIKIEQSQEPEVMIVGTDAPVTGLATTYTARLDGGISTGLTWDWQSARATAGTATMTAVSASEITMLYATAGTDTLRLIGTNAYGADTAYLVVNPISISYASLPYSTGFEANDDRGWTISNGPNGWFIDSATAFTGSYSLYISTDSGATHGYSITNYSNSFAYKAFNFANAGQYGFSFDWHNLGENSSSYDYLKAYVVPANDNNMVGGDSYSTIPGTWRELANLYGSSAWQTNSSIINIDAPGVYYICFRWYNDGSVGNNPPAAVDNIELFQITCPSPVALTFDTITTTTARFHWTPTGSETSWLVQVGNLASVTVNDTFYLATGLNHSTNYGVRVRALCGAGDSSLVLSGSFWTECDVMQVPYYIHFNTSPLNVCWSNITTGGTTPSTRWSASANYGNDYIYSYAAGVANPTSDYLISPAIQIPATDTASLNLVLQIAGVPSSYHSASEAIYQVLVSPTGAAGIEYFTDTLVTDSLNSSTFEWRRFPLSSYAGQTIRITVRNISKMYAQIALYDFAVRRTNEPMYYVYGSNVTLTGNINNYTAEYQEGDLNSMTLNWTSSMAAAGQATMTGANTDSMQIVYNVAGVDSVTFIAANAYGADTTIFFVTVHHCDIISTFPYTEGFEAESPCWTQEGDAEWTIGMGDNSTSTGSHSGSANARITHTDRGNVTKLISPVLNLSSGAYVLSFWHLQRVWAGDQDELRVYYRTSQTDTWHQLMEFTDDIQTWTKDSIELPSPSSTYQIAFEMTDDYGYGVAIDDLVISGASVVCNAPVITGTTPTENSVTVNFTSEAAAFEVAIVEGNAWAEPTVATPVTAHTYTFTGLTDSTDYMVGVRAVCEEGVYSDWTTQAVTTLLHNCVAPTNVTLTVASFNGAFITWTAGGDETEWEVHVYNNTYEESFTSQINQAILSGLTENTTYNVEVRALCSATNFSEWSTLFTFTTDACMAPTGITVSNIGSSSATVSWTAAESSDGTYQIEYGFSGFSRGQGTTVEVTGTTYTITGLESEIEYDVYVASYCGENIVSPWTPVQSFTTVAGGQEETYTITVQSNNTAWGTVTGGGTYPAGTQVTLTATATSIGEFVEWQDGNTEAQRSIVVTGNATYTATFREKVGIDDVDGNAIALYPNPASTTVTIAGMELQSQIVIVDMNGREVYRANAADGSVKVDVSNLSKGAYFVRITGEKTNAIRKLVVK